ncbi:hypothetical protein [Peribacillus sp. NPDC097895]|uniref:hypothetical protein n=1 Tax=Peribacillus sp. NPDC097895 TaxID=3390619 RepID=UPI003CFF65DC
MDWNGMKGNEVSAAKVYYRTERYMESSDIKCCGTDNLPIAMNYVEDWTPLRGAAPLNNEAHQWF